MSIQPLPLKIAVVGLGLGAVGLVAVLAKFWGANPEYADRFLILLGAAYVAWSSRDELAALPPRPTWLGWPVLLVGATAFPIGWYLQAQVAPKPVVIWWLATAWIAAAAGVVLLLGGPTHLRRLAFPLVFILFACPIPNRVLVPLQDTLQRATTSASATVLPLLGVSVEREGFILRLPGGNLGVAEACSGVRSVTTLTAIAAFVAWLKGFGPSRGLTLFGLSIPVIAAVNAFRVVLSGLIQEWFGAKYIQGNWHEALGIGMIFVGLGLILLLADRFETEAGHEPPRPEPIPSPTPWVATFSPITAGLIAAVLALAGAGTAAAQFLGHKAEIVTVATAPLEQMPLTIGKWKGEDLEIPHYVTEMLTYDKALFRRYRGDLGDEVEVWVIFWSSQSMVKGYHHPDNCLSNQGFKVQHRERRPITVADGAEVSVTVREFASGTDKYQRKLVLYWTQEGRRVWSDEDEHSARLTGDSHRWLSDRLFSPADTTETGRIVVLISTPLRGDGTVNRKVSLDFARDLSNHLYQLCPWATPQR